MHFKNLVAGTAVFSALLSVAFGTTLVAGASVPPAVSAPAVAAAVAKAPSITKIPSNLTPSLINAPNDQAAAGVQGCVAADTATTVKKCIYGNKKSTKVVALVGDSHAGMWSTALNIAALRAGWKVVLYSKTGCPAVNLPVWDPTTGAPYTSCNGWHKWILRQLHALKPTMIVLTSEFFDPHNPQDKSITDAEWSTGLTATIHDVQPDAKTVKVIGDIPYLTQSDPECLAAHETAPQACNTPATTAVNSAHDASEKAATIADGAQYIDVVPWICSSTCTGIIRNMVVYHNQYHLTGTYSSYLSGVLGTAVFG